MRSGKVGHGRDAKRHNGLLLGKARREGALARRKVRPVNGCLAGLRTQQKDRDNYNTCVKLQRTPKVIKHFGPAPRLALPHRTPAN